jgi:hypothetical protein
MEVRFAEEYAIKADAELVRLWADRDSLLPEALDALSAEIQKRELDLEQEMQAITKIAKREEHRETRRRATMVAEGYQAAGYGRIGRANYEFDEASGHEAFDTIVFVFFMFFPVWPQTAFRIERSRNADDRWRVLQEVPIPWSTVREIWAKAAFTAAFVFFLLTLAWPFIVYGLRLLTRLYGALVYLERHLMR